jgi:hypothetical protein
MAGAFARRQHFHSPKGARPNRVSGPRRAARGCRTARSGCALICTCCSDDVTSVVMPIVVRPSLSICARVAPFRRRARRAGGTPFRLLRQRAASIASGTLRSELPLGFGQIHRRRAEISPDFPPSGDHVRSGRDPLDRSSARPDRARLEASGDL